MSGFLIWCSLGLPHYYFQRLSYRSRWHSCSFDVWSNIIPKRKLSDSATHDAVASCCTGIHRCFSHFGRCHHAVERTYQGCRKWNEQIIKIRNNYLALKNRIYLECGIGHNGCIYIRKHLYSWFHITSPWTFRSLHSELCCGVQTFILKFTNCFVNKGSDWLTEANRMHCLPTGL